MPILYIGTCYPCGVLFIPQFPHLFQGWWSEWNSVHANALNSLSRSATGIAGPVIGAFTRVYWLSRSLPLTGTFYYHYF